MTENSMQLMQENLQKALNQFWSCQKEYEEAITKRQQLDAQLNENTCVKNELDLLKDDGLVYKLIGPVLIKQDLVEAKENVGKRMEYISNELKRLDNLIADIDKKKDEYHEALQSLEKSLQEATIQANTKK